MEITFKDRHAALICRKQKIEFQYNDGYYTLFTYIRKGGEWKPLFDKGQPLIQGASFGCCPDTIEVLEDSTTKKTVRLLGRNVRGAYDFEWLVEAKNDSSLIHFTVVSHLARPLVMNGYEPRVMLWKKDPPENPVTLRQELPNYSTKGDEFYWKNGMPAAYLFTEGIEAAIYFNMAPMTWYSMKPKGISRFLVSQVRVSDENGSTGMGLDLRRETTGKQIAAMDMVIDFFLYGNTNPERPTKLQALKRMTDAFAECFPATTKWPVNYIDGILTHEHFTGKIIKGLMAKNFSFKILPPRGGQWTDGPMFEERKVDKLAYRPGYVSGTGMTPREKKIHWRGDWNCNNNTLIPWTIYERIHPNKSQHAMLDLLSEGLLTYFDRAAGIYRSLDTYPAYLGNRMEFTFQNFFMQQGALWTSNFRRLDEFDPALGGKFLQALQGMIRLAHNVDYTMPQLFSAKYLNMHPSIDSPELGITMDVWTGGIIAYLMCLGYDITGENRYLDEADKALNKLFHGMGFYVNVLKEQYYTDPYDFPVNEVSSAPWGVAAAQWLFRITGKAEYLEYSENIRNLTLRMMNWFDSDLPDDPMDHNLPALGLVRAFSVVDTPCPWENINTFMPMLMELKNDSVPVNPLMLKIYNLFRINVFALSGACWNPDVVTSAKNYQSHVTAFFMPEDYYTPEMPTIPGYHGANNYMSNCMMYAYILYDAYARIDDKDMMVLNLDIIDEGQKMAEGICRNFILFNPTAEDRTFHIRFFDLIRIADYRILQTWPNADTNERILSGRTLHNGFDLTFKPREYRRIRMELMDSAITGQFLQAEKAQKMLMQAYCRLQTAGEAGVNEDLLRIKSEYLSAAEEYSSHEYARCTEAAVKILDSESEVVIKS